MSLCAYTAPDRSIPILEEQTTALFTCPFCQYQESIAAEWDGRQMRAVNQKDAICPKCSEEMER